MITHKDVEFVVDQPSGREKMFRRFDEACAYAVTLAVSDGRPHNVDVLISSEAGAKAWGGDDGVEQYRDDPDASVSDRVVIRAENMGRVA